MHISRAARMGRQRRVQDPRPRRERELHDPATRGRATTRCIPADASVEDINVDGEVQQVLVDTKRNVAYVTQVGKAAILGCRLASMTFTHSP